MPKSDHLPIIHLPHPLNTMTVNTDTALFDNLFDELYSPQDTLEELSPEAFAYYLAHGSLDCDAELN